ncbi:MAG: AAA family ATPase [Solirubrobacterales bacterium]
MSDQPGNQQRRAGRRIPGSLGFWSVLVVGVLLVAYFGVLAASRPSVDGDRLRLDSFVSLAEAGRINNAEILDQDAYVVGDYQADNGTAQAYNLPYFKSEALREQLSQILLDNQIPTTINQQFAKSLVGPLTFLLPALILVVIFIYFIISWRSGTGLFGVRSGARRVVAEEHNVTFDDVAGQEGAVEELREISTFLSDPDRFASLGAQIPKGVLLFGPPGCGKTLMARALAGEAGAAFYSISGSDFVELYVGVGAARVRDLFKEARENAPAIVFIDELDAVGRRRIGGGQSGGAGTSSEEQNQALNQLLAEIDGFSPAQGVIVIGATNRPDVLDPALLRPGRFDRAVGLELPDEQGRLEILRVHARSKALASKVDLDAIARRAVGMTGADLAGLMNEAALRAGRASKGAISQDDLEEAVTRIREAPERQRRLSMRDRRIGQALLGEERVTFGDVAGVDGAIEELREVREYLADPARFEELGARIPRGYLISGPPGTGKTLLARAVAGEANAAFVSASATEFVEVYVGEGAGRVRDLFAQARGTAPAILFIDELDAIGARRGLSLNDHSERQQTLNQLLVELDGFGQRSGVIVMAATNRPDVLDPALTRPGRFDRTIELDLPDREARLAILNLHTQGKRLKKDADLETIATLTRGLSGAELAGIMNEAALLAARRGLKSIPQEILEEALERVGLGIGGSRRLSDDERRMVAYHEAGHGLVARALPGGRMLHKISIVGRGRFAGTTWHAEEDDRLIHSRSLLLERMATFLGGRAAEELVFGELSDGAASDLAAVGAIARRMVAELGMSDTLGAINYPDEATANGRVSYSEETARMIDEEARKLVREAELLAEDVLRQSRKTLDRVAEALLDRETLTLEDVDEIGGQPVRAAASRGPAHAAG